MPQKSAQPRMRRQGCPCGMFGTFPLLQALPKSGLAILPKATRLARPDHQSKLERWRRRSGPVRRCATACVSAETLGRQWVGIDLSELAATLVKTRLKEAFKLFYEVHHRDDIPKRTDLGKLPSYRPDTAIWKTRRSVRRVSSGIPVQELHGGPRGATEPRRLGPLRQLATSVRGV